MLPFNPMRKQCHIMNELILPPSKKWSLILENFAIPCLPNMPTSCDDHFHKERLGKTPSSWCYG